PRRTVAGDHRLVGPVGGRRGGVLLRRVRATVRPRDLQQRLERRSHVRELALDHDRLSQARAESLSPAYWPVTSCRPWPKQTRRLTCCATSRSLARRWCGSSTACPSTTSAARSCRPAPTCSGSSSTAGVSRPATSATRSAGGRASRDRGCPT